MAELADGYIEFLGKPLASSSRDDATARVPYVFTVNWNSYSNSNEPIAGHFGDAACGAAVLYVRTNVTQLAP